MGDSAGRPVQLTEQRERSPADDLTDASKAGEGDAEAFERLYRAHVGRIHSLARRMMGTDDADEATQDVFVRVWDKIHTFRGDAAFGTWLHRLAINVILAKRQARGTRRERMHDGEEVFDILSAAPAQSDLSMDFEQAIAKLPAGAREVFVLHDVEGFKHKEIADMLGVTSGTSKAQLHRARMTLRGYLDR